MVEHFNAYSQYYNLLYATKNYTGEVDYVNMLIHNYAPQAKTILEYGSGTGGHGLLLQQKGFDVYGLEQSASMVNQAKAQGFECEVADITSFKIDRSFDVVISMFHVISYLNENEQLIAAFKNAADHLNEGGIFLFDVWYTPAVYHQMPETRKKLVENDLVKVIRIAEPEVHYNRNVVDVNYHIIALNKSTGIVDEIQEKHSMRHFSLPEMELLASSTGFKIIKTEEFLTGEPPSQNSWGLCFLLQKI